MTAWMPIDHMNADLVNANLVNVDLEVQRATTSVTTPDDEQFQLWAETVLINKCTLAIRIVDEKEGRRFNREYRDKDYATNVLSFPSELPAGLPTGIKQSQLGDLLICAPVLQNCCELHLRTVFLKHHSLRWFSNAPSRRITETTHVT